ncbi:MAG: YggT family protein [Gammaproteobacteria bacterium]|nr:YggT family protein [Gammaproteobacteria bacterium]
MRGGYVGDAGSFVIDFVLGLYILCVLLRFLFQLTRADFYNPISQFLVKVTNPPLLALRRVIPGMWGIDLASIALLLILSVAKLYLLGIVHGRLPSFAGALTLGVAQLLELTVNVVMVAIIIRIILSWVSPYRANPIAGLLTSLTEPVMAPARRIIPAIGGLDLSPIVVFLALGLVRLLLVVPMIDIGNALAAS